MKQKRKYGCIALVMIAAMLIMTEAGGKKIQDDTLSGVMIVIDSGHGGKDNGAMANEANEDEINLLIAKKVRKALREKGAGVVMTRTGDYDLASESATSRKKEDMRKRVEMINQNRIDLFISIHLNAYPSADVHGVQIFYQKGNTDGELLASYIAEEMVSVSDHVMHNKAGDYYILNETGPTGLLIECGFLSNPQEQKLLQEEDYQLELAQAIVSGIEAYFVALQ
ncbi:N-acetylmuramoyl-L-alanine amidase [Massilicoli timonensis]|uniref:N-acetylmuramoyl-L-alanine amidase n=1 Tax=Massilicoli timonensis TaxID=2015901 RepID=UPI003079F464